MLCRLGKVSMVAFWLAVVGVGSPVFAGDDQQKEGSAEVRAIYIDEVNIPESADLASGISLTFSGAMPDPSWEYIGCEVKVEDFVIRVTPQCRKRDLGPGVMTIMVIVPVSDKVTVPVDKAGVYRVKVEGYQSEFTGEVEVK
jgi:hypothetical protein